MWGAFSIALQPRVTKKSCSISVLSVYSSKLQCFHFFTGLSSNLAPGMQLTQDISQNEYLVISYIYYVNRYESNGFKPYLIYKETIHCEILKVLTHSPNYQQVTRNLNKCKEGCFHSFQHLGIQQTATCQTFIATYCLLESNCACQQLLSLDMLQPSPSDGHMKNNQCGGDM